MSLEPNDAMRPMPEAEALYRRWVAHLNEEFGRHTSPGRRSEIVRDELIQIYLGRPHGGRMNVALTSELATNVLIESLDPRNATMRSEYNPDIDVAKFAARKPLIWFWQMFDRSPLGMNLWLGMRLRCMLGRHIFAKLGKGVAIYRGVEFTYGYNITIGDNCTLRRGVYLDDLAPMRVEDGVTVDEGARWEPPTEV